MRNRLSAATFGLVLLELQRGPCTIADLVTLTGFRHFSVSLWLTSWHRTGCVHVSGWDPDPRGSRTRAVYALGEGKDVPRPTYTRVEISQRARDRQRLRVVEGRV